MRALRFVLILSFAFLSVAGVALAQEGHPLKGSWLGTWGPSETHLNDVIVIMDWDGENITGIINPGTDNVEIKNATLNPDGWVLRFEADMVNQAGTTLHYVVDGKIENLAFHDRTITGTWRNESGTGPFRIQRQ
jgi:hypothetical protein